MTSSYPAYFVYFFVLSSASFLVPFFDFATTVDDELEAPPVTSTGAATSPPDAEFSVL